MAAICLLLILDSGIAWNDHNLLDDNDPPGLAVHQDTKWISCITPAIVEVLANKPIRLPLIKTTPSPVRAPPPVMGAFLVSIAWH